MEIWPKLPCMPGEISIIPSSAIDTKKWNACINRSPNGLIYGTTLYLDQLADNWSGLVLNDYEAVMPIPWRKKLGIVYCYDVPFLQQLGVVYQNDKPDLKPFVGALHRFCRYGTYPFNFDNNVTGGISCHNFVLDISVPYERLWASFSEDARQQTKPELQTSLHYQEAEYEEAVELFRELYGKSSGVGIALFDRVKRLCSYLQKEGNLFVRKACSSGGNTMAIALMPKDKVRLYNIINGTVSEGKKVKANYFLLSRIWMEFCGSGLQFDFEGSDIPGVRDFYRKFRPRHEPYSKVHINRLPALLKMFKK